MRTGKPSLSRQALAIALSPKILELIILPTEACNFRCVYCFEDHIPGKMSAKVVGGIKKLIDRRVEDLALLKLSWFGGEPLIGKDIIYDISEFAHKRCAETGTALAGKTTTNGYFLTPAVMARLSAVNQKHFIVSLAGIGAEHDRWRPLASGEGTFDRIWSNLLALKATDLQFTMTLSLHFSPDVAVCEALCRKVNVEFAGDQRFNFQMQRISDIGGENAGTFATLTADHAWEVARHLDTLMTNMQSIAVASNQTDESFICGGARPNVLIVRPDGQISKCMHHLNDAKTYVGRLDEEGWLSIDGDRMKPWLAGFDDLDPMMLACPYESVPADRWPQQEVAQQAVIPLRSIVRRVKPTHADGDKA